MYVGLRLQIEANLIDVIPIFIPAVDGIVRIGTGEEAIRAVRELQTLICDFEAVLYLSGKKAGAIQNDISGAHPRLHALCSHRAYSGSGHLDSLARFGYWFRG